MLNNAVTDIANTLRERLGERLARIMPRAARSLARTPRGSAKALRGTISELSAADSRTMVDEGGFGMRGTDADIPPMPNHPPIPAYPSFDPTLPASVANLPPTDQLSIISQGGGLGHNYLVRYGDQPIGIYKPRSANPTATRNEVTAFEASRYLGVGNVPYTREWAGPHGYGSLQEFVPNDGPSWDFTSPAGQNIGTFDYIMGGGDAHIMNALQRRAGGIVRIDNEAILPERSPDGFNLIRSDYVTRNLGQHLPDTTVARLNQIDTKQFSTFLQSRGHSQEAADWAAARLTEVQRGSFTGESWGFAIVDEGMRVAYPPGYQNLGQYVNDPPKP
ncbi:hypothetical protein [Nocardia tengchongensis]|uniref:hypothetical protein n=1 Tax=Nocardia tengchongensis TaxID=2055889 RepID=UPI0036A1A40D